MKDQVGRDRVSEILATGRRLRRRLGSVAASIATTEDAMAGTLERMARDRPADASRLLARAAQARSFAAVERDRAADYGQPADSDPAEPADPAEPSPPAPSRPEPRSREEREPQ